ncbi:methylmalonyl-CoA mutase family protein [Coprothermobacter proteolyticus]|uniref:acyl-CoA mutase large subunit family protein n=1 Tax=Coprothermobacter proteolyticus TaxID=35786 RepID=UPI000D2FAEAB|nr:methylmalonyl-CoA mutase family protein [Coprothermobacter proteolyticus]NLT84313.1 methylmalonyl-CoA mutase family protein [Coprothermobacter proteolyticus]HOK24048.1 methylmalonyl-CoA mutase family protein [Coprothermobacter proteolyticus]HOL53146.1 methylmalonyl-CoA mutase family protein [Coprothermobacter proteolyticus]
MGLEEGKEKWMELYNKHIGKYAERQKEFVLDSGLVLEPVYDPTNSHVDYEQDLGWPGMYPFTRGVQPNMYRGRFWTMRQYAGYGTAKETNERFRYLLEQGQTGLSVAFDLPTQIGYDSDHELSMGEVGKVGVAIDTVEDMHVLFDQIDLSKVSTSMTINAPAAVLLAMYIVVAEENGLDRKVLSGTIQNDILKEYVARGTYIFPPKPSLRLIADTIEFCAKEMPKWNPISISGYHIREAGANAVEEIAFTFANAKAYVDAVLKRNISVDDFAGQLSFFFAAHNNLLEEVAKFRAARRLWAKIMKEQYGATKERAMMLRFHTQTAGSTLTAQQPLNNIIRVTLQALAAVLGGTQSLHTNSYDEALSLPTEEAVKVALRTQQILAYESGVADTVDPLGGSYVIEQLTNELEEHIAKELKAIDDMGGAVAAIESGYMQKRIAESAYEYYRGVANGEKVIVGVNKFADSEEDQSFRVLRVDPKIREEQIASISAVKSKRDNVKVEKSLEELGKAAATENVNLMPLIIDAVRNRCTLGEIMDTLRDVFGEYRPPVVF